MSAADRVRAVVEPTLSQRGLEVVDVVHSGATLRITVDRPEGGIDLETVAQASQLASQALDGADPIPGRYTLEVSSPGIERPLRTPQHYRRALGATVAVKTHPGVEGDRRIEGILESADDTGVVVGGRSLSYSEIERARTLFTWGPSGATDGPAGRSINKSRKRNRKKKVATP